LKKFVSCNNSLLFLNPVLNLDITLILIKLFITLLIYEPIRMFFPCRLTCNKSIIFIMMTIVILRLLKCLALWLNKNYNFIISSLTKTHSDTLTIMNNQISSVSPKQKFSAYFLKGKDERLLSLSQQREIVELIKNYPTNSSTLIYNS
jgi:hypothetical protein